MPSIRSLLFLCALPLVSLCQEPNQQQQQQQQHKNEAAVSAQPFPLKDIVNSIPEESVRSALLNNLAPKFRDGVFEHDKKAIETIHSADPQLATKLVDAALKEDLGKQELRKRGNATSSAPTTSSNPPPQSSSNPPPTSSNPPPQSSSTPVQQSTPPKTTTTKKTHKGGGGGGGGTTKKSGNGGGTETGVLTPVTVKTTNKKGKTVEKTTSAFATSAETSAVVQVTTTNAKGQKITKQETVPAAKVTTTNAQGKTIVTASPLHTVKVKPGGGIVGGKNGAYTTTDKYGNTVVLSGTKSGQKITTTDAEGKTVVMTYTPGGGTLSELVVKTKHLKNGGESTVTSFAVVGGPTQGANRGTGKPSPGLQSGAAPTGRYVGEMVALFGGAVGVAALL